MSYYCPKCEKKVESEGKEGSPPVNCPECGADLYPEEILFQQMISGNGQEVHA